MRPRPRPDGVGSFLPRLVLLLALATPALAAGPSGGSDPVSRVIQYYVHLNDRNLRAAYDLKSAAARQAQSFQAFQKAWKDCESVGFYGGPEVQSNDGRTAVVGYRLGSVDALPGHRLRYGIYTLRTTLVKQSGRWWLDRIDVQQDRVEDAPRFEVDRPGLPVPALPQDVTVPGRFQMGKPVAVEILETGEIHYEVRARKRIPGVAPHPLAEWYLEEMPRRGWELVHDLAGGSSALAVGFRKGTWQVSITVTSTTWGGTDAPADPRGTNLEFHFYRLH